MSDFAEMDVWKVAAILHSPLLGFAASLPPGRDIPATSLETVKQRREDAHHELLARGFTDEQVETIRHGDHEAFRLIVEFLARGGDRYRPLP